MEDRVLLCAKVLCQVFQLLLLSRSVEVKDILGMAVKAARKGPKEKFLVLVFVDPSDADHRLLPLPLIAGAKEGRVDRIGQDHGTLPDLPGKECLCLLRLQDDACCRAKEEEGGDSRLCAVVLEGRDCPDGDDNGDSKPPGGKEGHVVAGV